MKNRKIITPRQVPEYNTYELLPDRKRTKYCIGIPVINEGARLKNQLARMRALGIDKLTDILIFDGGSNDGSTDRDFLESIGVKALLVKTGPGQQGAQFRMGFDYLLKYDYRGVITMDGNDKDSVDNIPDFIREMEKGYDFVQGSRFIRGGRHENTPIIRLLAIRLVHAPWISLIARYRWTDTTSAYRGIRRRVLEDRRLDIFRGIFSTYELLYYMSAYVPRLGFVVKEIPVARKYPEEGKTPTKIKFEDKVKLLWGLVKISVGFYGCVPIPRSRVG